MDSPELHVTREGWWSSSEGGACSGAAAGAAVGLATGLAPVLRPLKGGGGGGDGMLRSCSCAVSLP
jgi:hypothetical protein